jgi:hypothetical protein
MNTQKNVHPVISRWNSKKMYKSFTLLYKTMAWIKFHNVHSLSAKTSAFEQENANNCWFCTVLISSIKTDHGVIVTFIIRSYIKEIISGLSPTVKPIVFKKKKKKKNTISHPGCSKNVTIFDFKLCI